MSFFFFLHKNKNFPSIIFFSCGASSLLQLRLHHIYELLSNRDFLIKPSKEHEGLRVPFAFQAVGFLGFPFHSALVL